jgi:hypothetical protein
LGTEEFSHMKRFGILALALTFLTGAAVTSFAQDTTKTDDTTKKKKKKKKSPPPDDTKK